MKTFLVQFVPLAEVESFIAKGWRVVSHLGHHTRYSVLMEKVDGTD